MKSCTNFQTFISIFDLFLGRFPRGAAKKLKGWCFRSNIEIKVWKLVHDFMMWRFKFYSNGGARFKFVLVCRDSGHPTDGHNLFLIYLPCILEDGQGWVPCSRAGWWTPHPSSQGTRSGWQSCRDRCHLKMTFLFWITLFKGYFFLDNFVFWKSNDSEEEEKMVHIPSTPGDMNNPKYWHSLKVNDVTILKSWTWFADHKLPHVSRKW